LNFRPQENFHMHRIILFLSIGALGALNAVGQTVPQAQAGASAQSQIAVQTNSSGAQTSASGSATGSSAASSATSPAVSATTNFVTLPDGAKIDATLATSLDARWSRPGDDVEVRTEEDIKEDGKVLLKKGTHLVGHVTQAQMRAGKQTQSQLGIVFDHAVLKDGEEVPFSATIQALASAQPASPTSADDMMAHGGAMTAARGPAHGAGLTSGVASTANATASAAANGSTGALVNTSAPVPMNAGGEPSAAPRPSGAVGGLTAAGRLSSGSSGVFGLDGVSIDAAPSTAAQSSTAQASTTIVSTTKNIHLDSGTQLLLHIHGQPQ
jgi:hypothetical protein